MVGVTNDDYIVYGGCMVTTMVSVLAILRQFQDNVTVMANGQSATARCVLSTNWRNVAAKEPELFCPSVTGFVNTSSSREPRSPDRNIKDEEA